VQLYSIEFDQLTLQSQFDGNGNFTHTIEIRERRKINDLPLQTMVMYRGKMKGLNFESSVQVEVSNEPVKRERRTYSHKGSAAAPVATKSVRPTKTRQEQINEAAASGDIAAAITAGAQR